jgi:hypothetical protein
MKTMTNNKKIIALSLLSFSLVGCAKTSELYSAEEYQTTTFEDNYYFRKEIDESTVGNPLAAEIVLKSDQYANGQFGQDWPQENRKGARTLYPSIFEYTKDGTKVTLDDYSWTIGNRGEDANAEKSLIGKDFGRTKCLDQINPKFRDGVLSKLYNGQMNCMNYHNAALVQLDKYGYNTRFPASMVSGDYFLMSFRCGSSYADGLDRVSQLDMTIHFFVKNTQALDFYTITAQDVLINTDSGGETETYFAFSLKTIGIADPKGLCGMGVSFSNLVDKGRELEESFDHSESKKEHFGVLLYEVMFPDSTWN